MLELLLVPKAECVRPLSAPLKKVMGMRKTVLLLASMAVALLLSGMVALVTTLGNHLSGRYGGLGRGREIYTSTV